MKRVLLKLSGEALAGDKKTGFDEATCIGVANQVKKLVNDGCQDLVKPTKKEGQHKENKMAYLFVFVFLFTVSSEEVYISFRSAFSASYKVLYLSA